MPARTLSTQNQVTQSKMLPIIFYLDTEIITKIFYIDNVITIIILMDTVTSWAWENLIQALSQSFLKYCVITKVLWWYYLHCMTNCYWYFFSNTKIKVENICKYYLVYIFLRGFYSTIHAGFQSLDSWTFYERSHLTKKFWPTDFT